jgi:hypothetical protein
MAIARGLLRNAGGLGAPVATAAHDNLTGWRALDVHQRLPGRTRPGVPLRFVSGPDC